MAVLTNGSLLWDETVRNDLSKADVVMPSLDVGTKTLFQTINRPHPAISFDRLTEGIVAFRRQYRGLYWLEVLLLSGYTAMEAEVKKIAKKVAEIKPDVVHLNTCVRPPAENYAYAVEWRELVQLANLFSPPAEVIAELKPDLTRKILSVNIQAMLQLIKRRPCTAADIATGLSVTPSEAVKNIEILMLHGLAKPRRNNTGDVYYVAS